ncbi:MAG: hypothetical protein WAO91_03160 [Candidatus Nitrosotenuis sp.]
MEIPDPNYPKYKMLDHGMPKEVMLKISEGKDPEKYRKHLLLKDHRRTQKIIKQTGNPYDVIFDLHDNTKHPDVWKYKKAEVEEIGGYKNEDGHIVSPLESQIDICYDVDQKLESLTKSFRPRIYPKIPFEVYQRGMFSDNTIGLEYYPARLDKWTKEVHKLPVTKGLQFLTRLIYHVRDNYE